MFEINNLSAICFKAVPKKKLHATGPPGVRE